MFDHMDGVMRHFSKKKSQWKEDSYFSVMFAWQTLSNYYAEFTATTEMVLISAHILHSDQMLWSFRKWDDGLDINPEDDTFYTIQNQEAFLMYVENEYWDKHRCLPSIEPETIPSNSLSSSATDSRSGQSSSDIYDMSSNDEEYWTPEIVAEMTPGQSDCAPRLVTATRFSINSLPELPVNWGQIDPNHNEYHSNPMEIRSRFWIPDITDWWRQPEETHSK